jgi:NADPH:quinone reductase-like Zn-dependent oxidoreductase
MHAIQLNHPSLDSFRRAIVPDPHPERGEVLVRMHAASLNYADFAIASGLYPAPHFPLIPVADGAGEVVMVGEGVFGFAVGDRVILHPKAGWIGGPPTQERLDVMRGVTLPGVLGEFSTAPANTIVKVPAHLSWEQAAALPIAATTAWNALNCANIGPGSTVVLLGTGGVSLFALQLAKARGARVILTSSSDEKLDRARAFGPDHLVNYRRTPEWDAEILKLTNGEGADLVLETVGPDTIVRSISAAKNGGTVFMIGYLSGSQISLDTIPIIAKQIRMQGNNLGSVVDFEGAVRAIDAHRIEPVIDHVYDVAEVREAYIHLAAGKHFGKLAFRLAW